MPGSFIVNDEGEIIDVDDETSATWARRDHAYDARDGEEPDEDAHAHDVLDDEDDLGFSAPLLIDAAPFADGSTMLADGSSLLERLANLDRRLDGFDARLDALHRSVAVRGPDGKEPVEDVR